MNETLSINQNNIIKSIMIFPNPTSSQLNLSFNENLENVNIKIVSTLGQNVLEKQNILGNNFNFDVSNFSNGMYIVEVTDGISKLNIKFLKY